MSAGDVRRTHTHTFVPVAAEAVMLEPSPVPRRFSSSTSVPSAEAEPPGAEFGAAADKTDAHRTFVQSLVGKTVGINVFAGGSEKLIGKVLCALGDVLTVRHTRNSGDAWEEQYHYDAVTGKLDSHLEFTVLDGEAGMLEKMERLARQMSEVEQRNLGTYVLSVNSPRTIPVAAGGGRRRQLCLLESEAAGHAAARTDAEHAVATAASAPGSGTLPGELLSVPSLHAARRRARQHTRRSRHAKALRRRSSEGWTKASEQEGHVFTPQLLKLDSLSSASSASDTESDASSGTSGGGTGTGVGTGSESEAELDSLVGKWIDIDSGEGQFVPGQVVSVSGNELTVLHVGLGADGTGSVGDDSYEENYLFDRHTGKLDGWLSFKVKPARSLPEQARISTPSSGNQPGRGLTRRPSLREGIKAAEFMVKEVVLERDGTGLGMALQYEGKPPEHTIWVDALLPGKPAALSGQLQPGDQVLAINGQRVPFITIKTVGKLLAQPTIRLTTKRKVPMLSVTLTRSEQGLGMVLSFESRTSATARHRVWVDALLPGRPAMASGQVHVGDEIVAVNGTKVQELSVHQVNARLTAPSVTLSIKRNVPAMPTIAVTQPTSMLTAVSESGAPVLKGGLQAALLGGTSQGSIPREGVRHLVRRPSLEEGITEATFVTRTIELEPDQQGLGMALEYDGSPPEHQIWVDACFPGRPAALCEQLKRGDRIISVNGQQIHVLSIQEVSKLLAQSDVVQLEIKRKVLIRTVTVHRDGQGLGMVLAHAGKPPDLLVRVDTLLPDRPVALTQKVSLGDYLTEVNGLQVKVLSIAQVHELLATASVVQLTLERAATEATQSASASRQRERLQRRLPAESAVKRGWSKMSQKFAQWTVRQPVPLGTFASTLFVASFIAAHPILHLIVPPFHCSPSLVASRGHRVGVRKMTSLWTI